MKIPIAVCIFILIATAGIGWQYQQRLTVVRESYDRLVAEAAELGISLDPSNAADPVRITKRGRENTKPDAKYTVSELITFAKEMNAIEKNGDQPDDGWQERMIEIMARMMSLDSTQLETFITGLLSSTELNDESNLELIEFSIMTLADEHPQAALKHLTESVNFFKHSNMTCDIVSSSLAKWAKDDPLAALGWLRQNSEKFSDRVIANANYGLISGTAVSEPKLAFKLIGELGIKEADESINSIILAGKTPEERTAMIIAFREYLKTLPDENTRNQFSDYDMKEFTYQITQEGYDAGSKWITESSFTPTELESFASGLSSSIETGESGQWIEWIGKNFPSGKNEDLIRNVMRNWIENDYQAAGEWLANAPAGPTKNASISSYAEIVSHYEPETATQWALTLPLGEDRDKTLQSIYKNWPKSDSAVKEAADAFAIKHGIK